MKKLIIALVASVLLSGCAVADGPYSRYGGSGMYSPLYRATIYQSRPYYDRPYYRPMYRPYRGYHR